MLNIILDDNVYYFKCAKSIEGGKIKYNVHAPHLIDHIPVGFFYFRKVGKFFHIYENHNEKTELIAEKMLTAICDYENYHLSEFHTPWS